MSNSATGRDGGAFPNLEKPNLGVFLPGTGIPLFGGYVRGPDLPAAAMLPLFGERILPRATPRSAIMDRLPGESYFTIADHFIAPFVHISLLALNRIIPALDRRLNARQRRRIRRAMWRDMEATATRILETGRP